jgi:hypothetical protein
MQQHVFFGTSDYCFVSNVPESPHDEINGGIYILYKMHIIAYIK